MNQIRLKNPAVSRVAKIDRFSRVEHTFPNFDHFFCEESSDYHLISLNFLRVIAARLSDLVKKSVISSVAKSAVVSHQTHISHFRSIQQTNRQELLFDLIYFSGGNSREVCISDKKMMNQIRRKTRAFPALPNRRVLSHGTPISHSQPAQKRKFMVIIF